MKSRLTFGIITIILGALLFAVPFAIFPASGIKCERETGICKPLGIPPKEHGNVQEHSQPIEHANIQESRSEHAVLQQVILENARANEHIAKALSKKKMPCAYTAYVEAANGIIIVFIGLFFIAFKSAKIRIGLSIGSILTAVQSLLVPTLLIGSCLSQKMLCSSVMKPTLVLISAFIILFELIQVAYLLYKERVIHGNSKEN